MPIGGIDAHSTKLTLCLNRLVLPFFLLLLFTCLPPLLINKRS